MFRNIVSDIPCECDAVGAGQRGKLVAPSAGIALAVAAGAAHVSDPEGAPRFELVHVCMFIAACLGATLSSHYRCHSAGGLVRWTEPSSIVSMPNISTMHS